jgi:hypothetical protein
MKKTLLILALAASAFAPAAKAQDVIRKSYSQYATYPVRLVPGVPFCVEIPKGDTIVNCWTDVINFKAESTPGSNRAIIKALPVDGVVGKTTYFHIETAAGLIITISAEAVNASATTLPGRMEIMLPDDGPGVTASQAIIDSRVQRETRAALSYASQQNKEDFERWRREAVMNLRDSYRFGGDFAVEKVVDDKVQTMIYVPEGSDRATIEVIDRSGKQEKVNYEFVNGVYTVNKVLRHGEKFRLILGKEQAVISLK